MTYTTNHCRGWRSGVLGAARRLDADVAQRAALAGQVAAAAEMASGAGRAPGLASSSSWAVPMVRSRSRPRSSTGRTPTKAVEVVVVADLLQALMTGLADLIVPTGAGCARSAGVLWNVPELIELPTNSGTFTPLLEAILPAKKAL